MHISDGLLDSEVAQCFDIGRQQFSHETDDTRRDPYQSPEDREKAKGIMRNN
jgi:hypothetical protein